MADKILEAMQRLRARLLTQVAAIDRDIAEHKRIAETYDLAGGEGGNKSAPKKAHKRQKKERKALAGTVASLIANYKVHKDSGYLKTKYRTRINYDSLLRRIEEDRGHEKLADLTPADIQRFYKEWLPRGEAIAGSLVRMLRMLLGFGATVLGDPDCGRLSVPFVLRKMQFKALKRRSERLTEQQANQIRAKAHEMGMPSIALAQALQFELGLGQKDVIGEWVPLSEPGSSDVIDQEHGLKWLRGIRRQEIDPNSILRHRERGTINLRKTRMVMEELEMLPPSASPALIVCERTALPWRAHNFRLKWREIADACGIPPTVFNMDSRPRRTDESPETEGLRQDTESAG
jgi:hypothetical protein